MPKSIRKRFTEPKRARSWPRPIAPTNGGMIIGTSNKPPSSVLHRKSKRVIQCAKGSARSVVSAEVNNAMAKLMKNDCRCSGLSNSNEKYISVNLPPAKKAPLSMKLAGYNRKAPKKRSRSERKAVVEKFRSYFFTAGKVSDK